jgi:cytochrome c oxidase subunit I+III
MSQEGQFVSAVARHRLLDAAWGVGPGWRKYSAVNHSIVGMRFVCTGFVFFIIGGVLAMLIRTQLATSGNAFMDHETYNQVFTMHGTIMMFLFALPVLEGFAMYLLPKMLGARDLAFPRLSAYGYWCYLFGGSILVLSLFFGFAPNAGWFMYAPLSSKPFTPGINSDVWLLGVTFVEVSAVCAGVELVVSVLKVRSAGMALNRMPLFAWYMLVVGFRRWFSAASCWKWSGRSGCRSSTRRVAATPCCGSTSSGCSGIPRSTSCSCLLPVSSPR